MELRSQLKELSESSERRISDLEFQISQLCSTIANYENNNNQTGLNSSNKSSKKSLEENLMEFNRMKSSMNEKENKLDFDSAIEQISHLKSYIESTARDLNINFNFNEIWLQNGSSSIQQEQQKQKELQAELDKLKEENKHLREEYEKYKIRTNYLIKSAKQTTKVYKILYNEA
jgi:DNA repair exonuclease SbcCD ATPase subunit